MLLATYQHRFEHQQPTSIDKDALPCDLPSFLTDQKTHGISKVLGLLQTCNQQDQDCNSGYQILVYLWPL
jgi:hypothetical protein